MASRARHGIPLPYGQCVPRLVLSWLGLGTERVPEGSERVDFALAELIGLQGLLECLGSICVRISTFVEIPTRHGSDQDEGLYLGSAGSNGMCFTFTRALTQ